MEIRGQVRGREMHFRIGGVGGRAHRRGVRRPHCRGRRACGEQLGCFARRVCEDSRFAALKTETAQRVHVGSFVRRQNGLRDAARRERPRLREALQCSLARIRDGPRMLFGGEITG